MEMVVDIQFANLDAEGVLEFEIGRGHLGATQVEILNLLGAQPVRRKPA